VLGHEPVGLVDAIGHGGTSLRVGDRVGVSWVQEGCGACPYCQRHRFNFCESQHTWMSMGGGHAEFFLAQAAGCTRLPDGLSWEAAAPMFCAGYTVMSGYRAARAKPGDRVGVLGIGGLGHLAVQIAKALGHEVIAVTGSAGKRQEALDLGADEVLAVAEHAGRELHALGGVDVLLSTSNDMRRNSEILEGLRPEGKFVSMAIAAEPIAVDPLLLLDRELTVLGAQQGPRADLLEILELVAAGKVRPTLELYPIREINAVMQRLGSGKVRYRAVMTPDW